MKLALLKAGPQDLPASHMLQKLLIIFYFLFAALNTSSMQTLSLSLIHGLADIVMLFLFTYLLLRDKKQRVNQTFNAFLGVGLVIGVIHMVSTVFFPVNQDAQNISSIAQIIFFVIFLWVIVVYGHIIRHATETTMGIACCISLAYIVLNVMMLVSISDWLKA